MLYKPTQAALARSERLESYLSVDPDNLSLLVEAIQLQIEMGDALGARARLDRSLAKLAQNPQLGMLNAMCHLAEHDYAQAAQDYALLLPTAEASAKPVLLFNQAYAHFCLGDYAFARHQWRELLLDPATAPVQTAAYLCRALHHEGLLEDAIKLIEEAPVEQKTPELLGLCSAVALDLDNPELAKRLALLALQGDPQQIEALATVGSVGLLEGDSVQSMQALVAALELRPKDGRIWMSVAAGHLMQKNVSQATAAFERAAVFLPDHVGSLLGLAWCQIVTGDLAAARESVNKAMHLNRNFSETHGALAAIEALSGNRSEAQDAVRTAKLLDPEDLSSHFALAVLSGDAQNQSVLQRLAKRLIKSKFGIDIHTDILPVIEQPHRGEQTS